MLEEISSRKIIKALINMQRGQKDYSFARKKDY